MKLLAVVMCATLAALAQAELHWDKTGQYRLVDTEPFYYGPLRAFVPFVYSYKQVESKKTEESEPNIVEVMPPMPEFLPTITETIPAIAEVMPTIAEVMPTIAEVMPEIAEVLTTSESLPIVAEPTEQ